MSFRMTLAVAALLFAALPAAGQHQQPKLQQGWPCSGRVDPGVKYQAFSAIRRFVIKSPPTGAWKVRMAGRGFFSLIVKTRSELSLSRVWVIEMAG